MGQTCSIDIDGRNISFVDAVSCVNKRCEVKTCLETIFCNVACKDNSTCVAPALPRAKSAYCSPAAGNDFCVVTACEEGYNISDNPSYHVGCIPNEPPKASPSSAMPLPASCLMSPKPLGASLSAPTSLPVSSNSKSASVVIVTRTESSARSLGLVRAVLIVSLAFVSLTT